MYRVDIYDKYISIIMFIILKLFLTLYCRTFLPSSLHPYRPSPHSLDLEVIRMVLQFSWILIQNSCGRLFLQLS